MAYKQCKKFYFTELNALPLISVHNHYFYKYPSHRHDFYEMEYVLDGEINYLLNGKTITLKKGELVFVTPSSVHEYDGTEDAPISTITVHFNVEAVRTFPELFLLEDGKISVAENLDTAFRLLNEECSNKDRFSELALKNAFERVLILFLRSARPLETKAPSNDIFTVFSYINKNFSEDISLATLGNLCGYSTSYLCRLFKQETGLTPIQYLNKIRLESACRLLSSTDLSVVEICVECGFGCVRNFNREFKKTYSLTPIEYRKANIRP